MVAAFILLNGRFAVGTRLRVGDEPQAIGSHNGLLLSAAHYKER